MTRDDNIRTQDGTRPTLEEVIFQEFVVVSDFFELMKYSSSFTRRDFLKLSAAGALGLFLSESGLDRVLAAETPPSSQGRAVISGVTVYDSPTFKGMERKALGKDEVVPISEVVSGDNGNPYNNIWYRIGDEGYAYSGWLQPVETIYQKPRFEIREGGQLGEITVPFSISRLYPNVWSKNSYRLYYQSTHWIKKIMVLIRFVGKVPVSYHVRPAHVSGNARNDDSHRRDGWCRG